MYLVQSIQVRQSLTAPQAILGLGALSLTLKVKIITCIILSIVYQRLVLKKPMRTLSQILLPDWLINWLIGKDRQWIANQTFEKQCMGYPAN